MIIIDIPRPLTPLPESPPPTVTVTVTVTTVTVVVTVTQYHSHSHSCTIPQSPPPPESPSLPLAKIIFPKCLSRGLSSRYTSMATPPSTSHTSQRPGGGTAMKRVRHKSPPPTQSASLAGVPVAVPGTPWPRPSANAASGSRSFHQ